MRQYEIRRGAIRQNPESADATFGSSPDGYIRIPRAAKSRERADTAAAMSLQWRRNHAQDGSPTRGVDPWRGECTGSAYGPAKESPPADRRKPRRRTSEASNGFCGGFGLVGADRKSPAPSAKAPQRLFDPGIGTRLAKTHELYSRRPKALNRTGPLDARAPPERARPARRAVAHHGSRPPTS